MNEFMWLINLCLITSSALGPKQGFQKSGKALLGRKKKVCDNVLGREQFENAIDLENAHNLTPG